MELGLDELKTLAGLILPISGMIYTFIATRRKDVDGKFVDVNKQFNAGSDRMDRHEGRIARLEQTVQTLPGKDDMHQLQLELVKQTGSLNEMRAVMEGNGAVMSRLEKIVTRHEEHLLGGGNSK